MPMLCPWLRAVEAGGRAGAQEQLASPQHLPPCRQLSLGLKVYKIGPSHFSPCSQMRH